MTQFLDEIQNCIPQMRRYARALHKNAAASDDLVQNSLEKAIIKQNSWSASGSIKSWVFKIMLNIYRDDLRKQRSRPQLVEYEEIEFSSSLSGAKNNTPQESGLMLKETAAAIDLLPPDQKQVLLMVVLEGFSYREGVELLEIPIGTFMSRLGRAREFLRKAREGNAPPARNTGRKNTGLRIVKK